MEYDKNACLTALGAIIDDLLPLFSSACELYVDAMNSSDGDDARLDALGKVDFGVGRIHKLLLVEHLLKERA